MIDRHKAGYPERSRVPMPITHGMGSRGTIVKVTVMISAFFSKVLLREAIIGVTVAISVTTSTITHNLAEGSVATGRKVGGIRNQRPRHHHSTNGTISAGNRLV